MLPRASDPAFHDAVTVACHGAGVAPRFIETPEPRIEHALLMVTAGAGAALLPASAAARYRPLGVRFRPIEPPGAVMEVAALTRPDADDTTIAAFLRLVRPARVHGAPDTELRLAS
jgi:DNA-binding transcriptional LysR family regulator